MTHRRALLVGAGQMGRTWAANLVAAPDVELVGWVDLRRDMAEQAAAELQLNLLIDDDLQRALAHVPPDFVVDVTVPAAHHAVTLTALAAGVPVLGEKPMADTLAHAREMVAASEQAGQLYMVSQNRRYHAGLHALRQLIWEHVGALGVLASDFFIGAHFGGFRETMPQPLLLDMAIHTFDAARYVSGADPVAVYCETWNPPWSWYDGDACATALFEMTGGVRYTYRGSWCSDGQHTAWDSAWRAVGPHGTATWDGHAAPVADLVIAPDGLHAQTTPMHSELDANMASGIAGSLRDFLHALNTGNTPMGECHDNIKSLAMVFAAIESAATGQRVPVAIN